MALKLSQAVVPITDLKTKSRAIVKKLRETGQPILITQRGRAAAVMESVEAHEARQERYEAIDGILAALREADGGNLQEHKEALKILETF